MILQEKWLFQMENGKFIFIIELGLMGIEK